MELEDTEAQGTSLSCQQLHSSLIDCIQLSDSNDVDLRAATTYRCPASEIMA